MCSALQVLAASVCRQGVANRLKLRSSSHKLLPRLNTAKHAKTTCNHLLCFCAHMPKPFCVQNLQLSHDQQSASAASAHAAHL